MNNQTDEHPQSSDLGGNLKNKKIDTFDKINLERTMFRGYTPKKQKKGKKRSTNNPFY